MTENTETTATDNMDMEKEYAKGWRPEEGDVVIGKVTDLSQGWSDQSQTFYPIVTILDEKSNEEVALHCFHHTLKQKMKELQPNIGERIGVKFKGKVPTKDGKRTVALYIVKVEGRGAVNIWQDSPTPTLPPPPPEQVAAIETEPGDDIPF